MRTSGQIRLVQIEPKVVWDSTQAEMIRTESDAQSGTIDKLLDSPFTVHIATRYNSRLAAKRVTCAEVRRGSAGTWAF